MKNYRILPGFFFSYVVLCWPLLLNYYEPFQQLCDNPRVCMIGTYLMAMVVVCVFFSMMALVLKAYKIALVFVLAPLFVELVVACSALLVFVFHRELTTALGMGRLRVAGGTIIDIVMTPVHWIGSWFHRA